MEQATRETEMVLVFPAANNRRLASQEGARKLPPAAAPRVKPDAMAFARRSGDANPPESGPAGLPAVAWEKTV